MDKIDAWHEHRTKIPPGRYHLKCLKVSRERIWYQGADGYGRSDKIVAWFEVFDGEHAGEVLPAFLSLQGRKIPQGSKYFQFWVVANGLRRPVRNRLKEMPLSKFLNKVFEGEVVDVRPKWLSGKEQPNLFQYSRVDALYELILGNPDR